RMAGDVGPFDIALGDDADDIAVFKYRQVADAVFFHQRAGVCERGAGVDVVGKGGHDADHLRHVAHGDTPDPSGTINPASKYIFLMYLDFAAKAAQNASCVCINPTMFIAGLIGYAYLSAGTWLESSAGWMPYSTALLYRRTAARHRGRVVGDGDVIVIGGAGSIRGLRQFCGARQQCDDDADDQVQCQRVDSGVARNLVAENLQPVSRVGEVLQPRHPGADADAD